MLNKKNLEWLKQYKQNYSFEGISKSENSHISQQFQIGYI